MASCSDLVTSALLILLAKITTMKDLQPQTLQILFPFLEELYAIRPGLSFQEHLAQCLSVGLEFDGLAHIALSEGWSLEYINRTNIDQNQCQLVEQSAQIYARSRHICTLEDSGIPELLVLRDLDSCTMERSIRHVMLPVIPAQPHPSEPKAEFALFFSRQEESFTIREQLFMIYLRPHIWRAEQVWKAHSHRHQPPLPFRRKEDDIVLPNHPVGMIQHLGLTHRQAEVMLLVTQGKDNCWIAENLGCSVKTVKKHLENIYVRLGVATRAAAVSTTMARAGFLQMKHEG
jgi:DNA-binding CsgD family transcriptional regulator